MSRLDDAIREATMPLSAMDDRQLLRIMQNTWTWSDVLFGVAVIALAAYLAPTPVGAMVTLALILARQHGRLSRRLDAAVTMLQRRLTTDGVVTNH